MAFYFYEKASFNCFLWSRKSPHCVVSYRRPSLSALLILESIISYPDIWAPQKIQQTVYPARHFHPSAYSHKLNHLSILNWAIVEDSENRKINEIWIMEPRCHDRRPTLGTEEAEKRSAHAAIIAHESG